MDPAQLFRLFRQAIRSCQLYPEGGPIRSQAAERLQSALVEGMTEQTEGISFAFLEEGVFVDGKPVPSETEESGALLARQVFELGVRELRFLPGLSPSECISLIDLLGRALQGLLNPVDEDLSVLLWESDLGHVGYLLYEDESLANDVITKLGSPPERRAEDESGPFALGPYEDDLALSDYVDQELSIGSEPPAGWTARVSEAERLRILTGYRQEVEDELPFKYARLLLAVLAETKGEDEEERRQIAQVLLGHLENMAALGRFALLKRLEQTMPEDPTKAEEAGSAAIWGWFRSKPLGLAALLSAVTHPRDQEAALELLSGVDGRFVPDLAVEILKPESSLLPGAAEAIRERMREDTEAQAACLFDPRPEVIGLLLEQAKKLPPSLAKTLRDRLRDPASPHRQQTAMALGRIPGAASVAGLVEALEDPSAEVRVAAAEALARGGAKALEPLLRTLASKAFVRRDLEEKRAFFLAAGRAAPDSVLPVLSHFVEQRQLFSTRLRREQVQAALEALALLGPEASRFLRDRWSGKRPDLLRRFSSLVSFSRGRDGSLDPPESSSGKREVA